MEGKCHWPIPLSNRFGVYSASMADFRTIKIASQWAYEQPLLAVRIDPARRWAVTSSEDNSLQRWTLAESPPKPMVLKAHESWVHALLFSKEGNSLLSGGCDGRLIWWSIAESEPKPIRTLDAHQGWIRGLALSPDGSQVASCGNDKKIALWNIVTGEKLFELIGHERDVWSVLFHPDGKQLISGDLMGKIHVWDLTERKIARSIDGKPLHTYEAGQRVDFGGVRTLAMSGDGATLLAGGLHKATNPLGAVHEPLCLRFDFSTGELKKSQVAEGVKGGVLWRMQFLPDGTEVGVSGGSSGGLLLFWNGEGEKEIHRLPLPNIARDMDLSSDGLSIATAHHDKHLRISVMT